MKLKIKMKTKIFNPALIAVMCLLGGSITFAQGSASSAKPASPATPADPSTINADVSQSKDYQDKMHKLQEQMRDLQKQMNSIRSEEFKKSTLAMREASKKLKKSSQSYSSEDNVSGLSKSLGVISGSVGSNSLTIVNGGDDYIAKRVQSGDAKEKIKNYSKTYSVDGNDKLQIENKFGRVTVNTWTRNEIKVDIQIKADADEDDDAQKLLDGVSISDSKDGDVVYFKTHIGNDDRGNWGSWFGSGKSHVRKIEVNYIVYMPAKNALSITNNYGGTVLADVLSGKVIINSAYGSLTAKTLSNPDNEIKVQYGSARIENLSGSEVKVSYGSLVIGESDKLNADVSYSSAKIAKLTSSGNINARFSGTVEVGDVGKNVTSLTINSSYSGVKLGLSNDQNTDFNISVSYGGFSYGSVPVSITSKTPEDGERGFNPTKTYKGKVGKGNADKVISIKSTFGSVKFD
jgi:TolA-binding protein